MNTLNSFGAFLLTGSLLTSGCIGSHSGTEVDPVEPPAPAPLETVVSSDMAARDDGCLYGTSAYSFTRESTAQPLTVSMQTSCPANYFIEGTCNPTLRYADGSRPRVAPLLSSVCFNPQVTTDLNIDPCQIGALVCAANLPGDETTTTTYNGSDGQQSTSSDTVDGANGADLNLLFRCCPAH